MTAGFRDINYLSGLWSAKAAVEPPALARGFVGLEHLTGAWVWGAAPIIPPEPSATRALPLLLRDPGRLINP